MDFRDILKSFDNLSEASTTTDKGKVHTSEPGGYGNKHGSEDVKDQYGNRVGRASLSKMGQAATPAVKRGKGRPPKNADSSGEVKSYDSSELSKAMGMGKAPKPTGKPSVKHSLKEYLDQLDKVLNEADAYTTAPMPGAVAVKDASGKVVATAKNPQAAAAFQKGDITLGGDEQGMAEGEMDEAVRAGYATTDWMKTPKKSAFEPDTSHIRRPTNQAERDEVAAAVKNNRIGNKDYRINRIGAKSAAYGHDSTGYEDENSMVRAQQDKGNTPKQWKMIPTAGDGKGLEEMWGNPYDDDKVDAINAANPPKAPSGQPNRMTPKPATQVASAPRQANTLDHDAWDKFTGRDKVTEKDVGKHNNATTGFDALVRKLTPKYGKEAATKIAGAQLKKMSEAEAPPTAFQSSPLTFEGKKGVNPFAKKDTKKKPDANKNGIPDYAEDGKGPNDTKKKGAAPKKGVNPFAKKTEKKKVKEGMEHHLQAARLEGKSHALRKMPYNCTHDDMEEARCYHDGFKEGLDECYGQMPILGRTAVDEMGPGSEVDTMASYGAVDEGMGDDIQYDQYCSARDEGKTHEQAVAQIAQRYGSTPKNVEYALNGYPEYAPKTFGRRIKSAVKSAFGMGEGEMDEGTAFTAGLAKTPHGGEFKVGGSTFTDRTSYDSNLDEFAFESLDKQLNSLLESEEKVSEGMTVSISKGQQGAPDSVSVSAQDGEADQLLSIIKSAGMGLFGGDEQNGYGAPQGSAGAHGGISVVDDHDGMMALMKKLSGGGEMQSGGDYENEEGQGEEDHMHGEEETCNECGGMMEENHQCGSGQQVVDEVESEDQMEFEVAENAPENAPDNGSANSTNARQGNDAANSALATADAGADEEEGEVYSSPTEGKEDTTGEEAGKEELEEGTCNKCDCKPCKCETMSESSFFNLFRKISMLSEESTEKKDEKAEKAGKKVANDIEYDEGHKGKDDNKAEKAGKKVTKDIEYDDKKDEKYKKDKKVDESYANSADDTFEADIDFMTKVISGGLNKQKSTGQTTVSVISGQKSRMGVDGLGSPMKESNDLLKDYRKLSGL